MSAPASPNRRAQEGLPLLAFGEPEPLPNDILNPGQPGERSLAQLVIEVESLSVRIVANGLAYQRLEDQYLTMEALDPFTRGNMPDPCRRMIETLDGLVFIHNELEREKTALNEDYQTYVRRYVTPNNLNQQAPSLRKFEELIKTTDNFDEQTENLPYMKDKTCDISNWALTSDGFTKGNGKGCSYNCGEKFFFTIFTGTLACCCFNQSCCGLENRAKQLKYHLKQGIRSQG